jgi:uncharacterized membrane protein
MRSRAHIGSHPIHPMLVSLPIGLAFATVGVDLAAATRADAAWWSVGLGLGIATVASGLLAALPGLVDFFLAVPPGSQARDRAVWHAVANGSGLVVFVVAQLVRGALPSTAPWALELAGIACLASAAGSAARSSIATRSASTTAMRATGRGRSSA